MNKIIMPNHFCKSGYLLLKRGGLLLSLALLLVVNLSVRAQTESSPNFDEIRAAAEQGNAKAQVILGMMYEKGAGVTQDDVQAVVWFRKSAEQGNAEAEVNLGWMYSNGRGVAKDETQAVTWYRKAAEQGLAEAQFNLGLTYENGEGVAQNDTQAVAWYRKAAVQGNTDAQASLDRLQQSVVPMHTEDVTWAHEAAEQGDAGAQAVLGAMYNSGLGVARDYTQALVWLTKAAEQGNAGAQYLLGTMYENGKGVTQNDTQAVVWYRKAAAQGDTDAQAALEKLQNAIQPTAKITANSSLSEIRAAANQGNADAQFLLGKMYKNGTGVAKDDTKAMSFYELAAAQGNTQAQAALDSLQKDMQAAHQKETAKNNIFFIYLPLTIAGVGFFYYKKRQREGERQRQARFFAEARAFTEYLKQRRALPVVATTIILKPGEMAFYSAPSVLYETRAVRQYHAGSAGFKVAKGVWIGGTRGYSTSTQEWGEIDRGTLIVTNKKVIFNGNGGQARTVPLDKIVSVKARLEGIEMSVEGRQKNMALKAPNALILSAIIHVCCQAKDPRDLSHEQFDFDFVDESVS